MKISLQSSVGRFANSTVCYRIATDRAILFRSGRIKHEAGRTEEVLAGLRQLEVGKVHVSGTRGPQ